MTTPECVHQLVIDSVDPPEGGLPPNRRKVHMRCLLCGETVTKLTTQTDEEMQAEIVASKAIEEAYEAES